MWFQQLLTAFEVTAFFHWAFVFQAFDDSFSFAFVLSPFETCKHKLLSDTVPKQPAANFSHGAQTNPDKKGWPMKFFIKPSHFKIPHFEGKRFPGAKPNLPPFQTKIPHFGGNKIQRVKSKLPMVTPSDQIQNHIGDPREFTFWGVRTRTVGVDTESSCTYFRQKSETSFHSHGAIIAQRICNLLPAARHIDCQLPFFPVAGHLRGAVRLSCGIFHNQSRAAGVNDVMVDGQVLVGVKGSTARHRPAKHQQPASHHPRIGLMALVFFGDLKNRSLRAMHIQILELVLFVFLFWLLFFFFFFCVFLFKFFCNKRGPCHVNFLSCLAPVTSPQRPCHSSVAGGAGEAAQLKVNSK